MDLTLSLPVVSARSVYQDQSTDHYYRVVLTGGAQNTTYIVPLDGTKLIVIEYPTAKFQRQAAPDYSGKDKFVYVPASDDPYCQARMRETNSTAHTRTSKKNWELVKDLIGISEGSLIPKHLLTLLRKSTRNQYLKQYSAEKKVGLTKLREVLRLYLQRGMKPTAVASGYANCGKSVTAALYKADGDRTGVLSNLQIERTYRNRPGRKPAASRYSYAVPSAMLRKLFWRYLDIYNTWQKGPWFLPEHYPDARTLCSKLRRDEQGKYLVYKVRSSKGAKANLKPRRKRRDVRGPRSRPSQRDLVDAINFELRATDIKWSAAGYIVELKLRDEDVVTLRQFNHFYQSTKPSVERPRRRHPGETHLLLVRPERGKAWQHVHGPGDLFLIDSTVLDVYAVSSYDRTAPVCRPTFYAIVDLWSCMIVAVHLSFDPPSRVGAAMALSNMLSSKKEFCAQYGFYIDDEDWPCRHASSAIAGDRASEFMAEDEWKAACDEIGLHIVNPPPYTPTWRSVQERRFGIVPRIAQKSLSGVVEADYQSRVGSFYPWDAKHTLAGLMLALLRAIHVYHRTPISGRQAPPKGMVEEGLSNTPLNRWRWGVQNIGSVREGDPSAIRNALWPTDFATVDEDGVHWHGIVYKSPNVEAEFWEAESLGKKKVKIRYDPASLKSIYFVPHGYEERCDLHPTLNDADLSKVTLAEWLEFRKKAKTQENESLLDEQANRIMNAHANKMDDAIAEIEQKAALAHEGKKQPETSNMKQERCRQRNLEANSSRRLSGGARAVPRQEETASSESTSVNSPSSVDLDQASRDLLAEV